MDLRKKMNRLIKWAEKQQGPDSLAVQMLQDRLDQLERPVSAQELFMSGPIVNRRPK